MDREREKKCRSKSARNAFNIISDLERLQLQLPGGEVTKTKSSGTGTVGVMKIVASDGDAGAHKL